MNDGSANIIRTYTSTAKGGLSPADRERNAKAGGRKMRNRSELDARARKKNIRRNNASKPAVQRKHFPPPREPPRQQILPRVARQHDMHPMEAATLLGAGFGLIAASPFGTPMSVMDQVSEMLDISFRADRARDDGVELISLSAPDVVEADPRSFRSLVEQLKRR